MKPYQTLVNATPETAAIVEAYRVRTDLHTAEKRLTLQGKAICRRLYDGDKDAGTKLFDRVVAGDPEAVAAASGTALLILVAMRANAQAERKQIEKTLRKLAESVPVAEWCEGVKGVSPLGLALIVGEAGNVGAYRNPSCLWKRFGLAVIDGERQRRRSDPDEALRHGFSPRRRASAWNVGNALIKSGGPYYDLYLERKAVEVQKAEAEGLTVAPAAQIPKAKAKEYRSAGHVHNRAMRYAAKRFLRDLWVAWREAEGEEELDKAA